MSRVHFTNSTILRSRAPRDLRSVIEVAGAALLLLIGLASAARAERLGWTSPRIVISVPHQDLRGYAATAFQRHAYVVDVTNAHGGSGNTSQIWFSTNQSGKWVRSLVAALPDDPGTDGAASPQIAVMPASGHVVIAYVDTMNAGTKLVSYSNASGSWQPLALSEGSGDAAIHSELAPALAAQGGSVTLAFNASYVATTAACSQNDGNIFVSTLGDGGSAWSPPRNVTEDYCQPSLFARNPVLAYSPAGVLYMLYQFSGDSNVLNALRLRSGTLAAGTEEVVEPAPASGNWGLSSVLGDYAVAFDAQGTPLVVYCADAGTTAIAPRLMYATHGAGGWTRSVLHQADKPDADTDVAPVAPAIASGESGITVAFAGAATYPLGGTSAQAVYLMSMNGNTWTPPANFTRSRYTDSTPILATANGLKHLLMLRTGVGYLYSRELPFPQISERLAGVTSLSGSVTPATAPEAVSVCLEHMLSATRWSNCQSSRVNTVIQGSAGQCTHAFQGLTAGSYRIRVAVPETDDHLAGVGEWLQFSIH